MKKSFGIILLILILILACGLGALAYFFMNQDARLTKVEAKVANLNSTENTNTVVNEVKTEKNEVEEELLDDVELPEDEDLILYEDLEGIYEIKDENREGLKNQLILYKDGTFSYSHGTETVANFSGNYIIDGKLYLAEPLIRKLLCRVFHYARITNANNGKKYTHYTIKQKLDKDFFDVYRDGIMEMASSTNINRDSVDAAFRDLINNLFLKLRTFTQ